MQGRELGWPAWTFAMMAAGLPVFALFGRQQIARRRAGGDPLVEPSLFRRRAFTGGLVAGLAFFSGMIGFGLAFSLYVQLGLGYSPLKAGLAGVPQSLGIVIGFGVAGGAGLTRRLGRRLLHLGLAVMAAATVGFVITLDLAGVGVAPWQLSPALGVFGLGMGLVMAPFFDIILAGVQPHETGSASGTLTAVQQLGSAVGIALLGTLFFNHAGFGPLGPDPASFADAMRLVLWVVAALLAVTSLAAFLLPRHARDEPPPLTPATRAATLKELRPLAGCHGGGIAPQGALKCGAG
ncbi:MFS transporter [Catellatospora coxensis]